MAKREVLRQYFGHTSFRPGQEALIDGILAGRDALGIMPTGGGKSLCYQVPALLLPGLTLVVSPLISLMKDQVAALNGVGIPAAFLNSALDAQAFQAVCREIRQGMHKLIYVAPERLLQEGIAALLKGRTSFIIAHRLSTIKTCDKIMYIADKHIQECGSHDELIARRGLYYNLYTAQSQEQGVALAT